MDPLTILFIVTLGLVGGGAALYKEKPDLFAKIPLIGGLAKGKNVARAITLDAAMPDSDKQAVIAAIMSAQDPAVLDGLAAKYAAYPYAVYELQYKAWQLRGSSGTPPAPPVEAGTTPAAPGSPPQTMSPAALAAQAAAVAQAAIGGGAPQVPAAGSTGVPQPPFDLSAASQSGAWKNNSTFITQYQSALSYLADKESTAFNPGPIDGKYGAATKAAVVAFQTSRGLTADGEVGPETAAALAAATGSQYTGAQGGYATAATMPGVAPAQVTEQMAGIPGGGAGTTSTERGPVGARGDMMEQIAATPISVERGSAGGRAGMMEQMEGVGVAPRDVIGAAAKPGAAPVPRPTGMPFVCIRTTDRAYPRTISEIGTGIKRGSVQAIKHLVDINPHLAPTGIIPQLTEGMELNVPESWAMPLKARGFDVRRADGTAY